MLAARESGLWFSDALVWPVVLAAGGCALIWRPSMVQNAIFRLSGAVLDPGKGFRDLFTNSRGDDRYYSVLFNAILTF